MGFLPSVEMTVLLGGRVEMTTLFLGFLSSVEMTILFNWRAGSMTTICGVYFLRQGSCGGRGESRSRARSEGTIFGFAKIVTERVFSVISNQLRINY